jgi:hypothetical protein
VFFAQLPTELALSNKQQPIRLPLRFHSSSSSFFFFKPSFEAQAQYNFSISLFFSPKVT